MGKPKIAIIMNVPGSRNAMLQFALDALIEGHEITVVTPDQFENASSFPGVSFKNFQRGLKTQHKHHLETESLFQNNSLD